jgi:voltage-gated potassium channel
MNLRRRLILALLMLMAMVLVAADGYQYLGGPSVTFLDAIYMAVITFATIGYGEVIDTSHNPPLRIFNMIMILFGIGIMLYVFSVSTAFVVEGELRDILRRRKMHKEIQRMKNHFIVCGGGETGQYIVRELLKTKHAFIVIDHDEGQLEKIQHLGKFPVLKGDASEEEVLTAAGLARARGLVSALRDERDNLMVTVTARQMNPTIRIVARCAEARMADKLILAGASSAVSPNMIGGLRLASELIRPHVVSFLDLMMRDKKAMRVEQITVRQDSPWIGKALQEIDLHSQFDLLVLALHQPSGEMKYSPETDVLTDGDVLVVMGEVSNLWKAREAAGEPLPEVEAEA